MGRKEWGRGGESEGEEKIGERCKGGKGREMVRKMETKGQVERERGRKRERGGDGEERRRRVREGREGTGGKSEKE